MTHLFTADVQLRVAYVSALCAAVGWLVNSGYQERQRRLLAELDFVKNQLEHLYGPLYFLVLEGRQTFRDLLHTLKRDYVFEANDTITGDELELWLYWAENEFLPRNEKLKSVIVGHTHLLEGSKLPQSFVEFLDHCNSWALAHKRWSGNKGKSDYAYHSRINWPKTFEDEVEKTFVSIKTRHSALLGKLSVLSSRRSG